MRLTKKKAIEITKELWEHLKKTGSRTKSDWLGWKKYGQMDNDCPCCEYAALAWERRKVKVDDICELCPLYGQWGNSSACCTDDESGLFDLWYDALSDTERKQAAQKIVDICDKALK